MKASATQTSAHAGNPAPSSVTPVKTLQYRDVHEQSKGFPGFDQIYDQLSPGQFSGHIFDLQLSRARLMREAGSLPTRQVTRLPEGIYTVIFALNTSPATLRYRGLPVSQNRVLICWPGEEVVFHTAAWDAIAVAIHADAAERSCVADFAAGAPGARYLNTLLTAETAARARSDFLSAIQLLSADSSILNTPPAQAALEEWLDNRISELLLGANPTYIPRRTLKHQRIVERAKDYLTIDPNKYTRVSELTAAVGVSRRALHYAFRHITDMTPARYLKVSRLNGVRRQLRSATQSRLCVGDLAAAWGFWHLGRFAADYEQLFGEFPSQTLQGARVTGRGVTACRPGLRGNDTGDPYKSASTDFISV